MNSSELLPDSPRKTRIVKSAPFCTVRRLATSFSTTEISDEERKKYEIVMEKYDGFFKVCRNVIFERSRFNRRYQRAGETAEQYINVLYGLVETCEYGTLKNNLLCDRLVVGIADQALFKKLQLMSDLTLDKANTAGGGT